MPRVGRSVRPAAGLLVLAVLSGACARTPPLERLGFESPPPAASWGPHAVPMEWWYVAGVDADGDRAFHVAFFRFLPPPTLRVLGMQARALLASPLYVAHVAVTDRPADRVLFEERGPFPWGGAAASFPPLHVRVGAWKLREAPASGRYRLAAGAVHVDLVALKPRVVHPPGHVGTAGTGRLFYESRTRLACTGTVAGQRFQGLAWLDHQWGDAVPGLDATWTWCGLHLDDGSDLMLFDLRGLPRAERQLTATWTDEAGAVRALPAVRMRATAHVTSPTGRRWPTAWRVEGEGLALDVEALRTRQEFVSRGACTTYWEGPVRVRGTREGRPVAGQGMAESVARTPFGRPAPALSRGCPQAAAPPPPAGDR